MLSMLATLVASFSSQSPSPCSGQKSLCRNISPGFLVAKNTIPTFLQLREVQFCQRRSTSRRGKNASAFPSSSLSSSSSSFTTTTTLFAIPPKPTAKENAFEVKASAFLHMEGHEGNDIHNSDLDYIDMRQQLEYGTYSIHEHGDFESLSSSVGLTSGSSNTDHPSYLDLIDMTLGNMNDGGTGAGAGAGTNTMKSHAHSHSHAHTKFSTSKPKLNLYSKIKALSSLDLALGIDAVWQARILLLVSAALYGTNFTFVKMLNENIPTGLGTSLRFALASFATLPWIFLSSSSSANHNKEGTSDIATVQGNPAITTTMDKQNASTGALMGGVEVGMWNSIGYLSQAVGLETTHAGTSAFICSLAVVVVPILDFLTGKTITSRQAIGAFLAVVGVAFLELDGFVQDAASSSAGGEGMGLMNMSFGDMLSLVQPFAFGMGFWRMEHYMRKFPTEAMKLTASQLSVIALASIVFSFAASGGIEGLPDMSQFKEWITNPIILGDLIWTGIVTTALTVYMETLALKTLSAAETTMLFSTEPIFGGACAAAVLGEQFGLGGFVGAALVLGGCLASNMGAKQDHENKGLESSS